MNPTDEDVRLLERLLFGQEPSADEVRRLRRTPGLADRVRELERVQALLDRRGALDRRDLIEAPPAPARLEKRFLRALGKALPTRKRRFRRRLAASAAIAAGLAGFAVGVGWHAWMQAEPAFVILSDSPAFTLDSPARVEDGLLLAWHYPLPAGGFYTLNVWSPPPRVGRPLLEIEEYFESTWKLDDETAERLPDHVVLEIVAHRSSGEAVDNADVAIELRAP